MHILVSVEDPLLGMSLQKRLGAQGSSAYLTPASEIIAEGLKRSYDLGIIDFSQFVAQERKIFRTIREANPGLLILALIDPGQLVQIPQMLDSDAIDFVVKPVYFAELMMRVQALERRERRDLETVLRVEDLEVNRINHTVKRAGRAVQLTPKEFALLEYLTRKAGQQVTRAQIIKDVWNLNFPVTTNRVDVYVNCIRKKVDAEAGHRLIQTVRGVGYTLRGS